MRTIKKVASHIFIDGFGGMTQGLFATLIIGTMIQQIGLLIGGFDRKCDLSAWKSCRSPDKCRYRCRRGSEIWGKPACHGFCSRRRHGRGYAGKITGGTFLWTEMPFWQDLANRSALSSQLSQASPAAIWFPVKTKVSIVIRDTGHHQSEPVPLSDCSSDRRSPR